MILLDLAIVVFVVLIVVRGARTGFLAGVFSLAGVFLGASLGSRLAPLLSEEVGPRPVYGAGITLLSILVFAVLGELVARSVGGAIRARLANPASEILDGLAGAVFGLALALVLVWAAGVFALQFPPLAGLRASTEDSRILRALDERMPSELLTRAVAELDPLPRVRGPEPEVAAPDGSIVGDPEVLAASRRAVRVSGMACGYGVEGSGWVAAPNLVVTNAHVVAGQTATTVQPGGTGIPRQAGVVVFDEKNDVAVLRVRGLGIPPLRTARPVPGGETAVLGFPENGPLDIQPSRTGATQRVISTDAYDRGPVERAVTSFRVFVRPGNSGGPAVNADGEVVATVFASRADSSQAGYGIPSRIVERRVEAAAERREPISTGGCVE